MEMIQTAGLRQWMQIRKLYRSAFPRNERKPLKIIRRNQKLGKSDVWYFQEQGNFVGLATTVNGDGPVLVDYFAVVDGNRGQGYGGKMLDTILKHYADRGIFGEIEIVDEAADNYEARRRRKQFYLRHGIRELGIYVELFGVKMELMSWGCELDFSQYLEFYCKNIGEFAREHVKEIENP